jgi:hypothetical protein
LVSIEIGGTGFDAINWANGPYFIKTETDPLAGLIWGLPESVVSNVLLKNVNIKADKPFGVFFAKNVQLQNHNQGR